MAEEEGGEEVVEVEEEGEEGDRVVDMLEVFQSGR